MKSIDIDYSFLTKKPTASELQRFRHRKDYPKPSSLSSPVFGAIIGGVICLLISQPATMFLSIFLDNFFVQAAVGLMIVAAGAAIGWFVSSHFRKKRDLKIYQLMGFAEQNGFSYVSQSHEIDQSGVIFSIGHSKRLENVLATEKPLPFEVGNYQYTTGSGKNSQTHYWGYVCIDLERHLPNMLLDASSNNSKIFGFQISNLPVNFDKDQTLKLEGDFNEYFTLYAPKEYERDALYVFTPDLMALLIDKVARFDAEAVDNKLYIYSPNRFNMLDEQVMARLLTIVAVVGKKVINRTDYYADQRVGDRQADQVAKAGRRLKRGVPILAIVIIAIWIASVVLPMVFGA